MSVRGSSSKKRQSLSAGAAGGAALGAVIALGIISSSIMVPLLGVVIGAASGAGFCHLINGFKKRHTLILDAPRKNAKSS
jgi:hypothetical protein